MLNNSYYKLFYVDYFKDVQNTYISGRTNKKFNVTYVLI